MFSDDGAMPPAASRYKNKKKKVDSFTFLLLLLRGYALFIIIHGLLSRRLRTLITCISPLALAAVGASLAAYYLFLLCGPLLRLSGLQARCSYYSEEYCKALLFSLYYMPRTIFMPSCRTGRMLPAQPMIWSRYGGITFHNT